MAFKFYYFDSYRVRLSFSGGAQGLTGFIDSDWIVADYSSRPYGVPYMTIDEGVDTVYKFHGLGYSELLGYALTSLPDYIDFVLALNSNFHCTYDDLPDGTFETGSITFADTNLPFTGYDTNFSANVYGDPSLYQAEQLSMAEVSGSRSSSTQDVQYLKLSNAPVTVGGVTIGTCPKFTAYERDTFTSKWYAQSANNRAELSLNAAIPASSVTVTVKSTPYNQTSVKRIYFTNSNTAIAFYQYMGANYNQVLVKGTGNIWYGLGDGYIDKALIFNDYAWVYINGNKYLCRSIGGNLNVY